MKIEAEKVDSWHDGMVWSMDQIMSPINNCRLSSQEELFLAFRQQLSLINTYKTRVNVMAKVVDIGLKIESSTLETSSWWNWRQVFDRTSATGFEETKLYLSEGFHMPDQNMSYVWSHNLPKRRPAFSLLNWNYNGSMNWFLVKVEDNLKSQESWQFWEIREIVYLAPVQNDSGLSWSWW